MNAHQCAGLCQIGRAFWLGIDRHRILEIEKKKKHDVMCRPMELYDKNMKYVLLSPKTFFYQIIKSFGYLVPNEWKCICLEKDQTNELC